MSKLDLGDGNWVPLFRKIRMNWVWQDPPALRAWLDLIMMANYHEGTFPFRGAILPVGVGQVPTTTLSLAERWDWSRDRVRRFLSKLKTDTMLRVEARTYDAKAARWTDRKTDSGLLLLTVINYPLRPDSESQPTGNPPPKPTGDVPGNRQEIDRNHATSKKGEEREEPEEREEGEGDAPLARLAGFFDWIDGKKGKIGAIKTIMREGIERLAADGMTKDLASLRMRRAIFQVSTESGGELWPLLRRARDEAEDLEDAYLEYASMAYVEGRREEILARGSPFHCDGCRVDLQHVANEFPDPRSVFEALERRVQSGELTEKNIWSATRSLLDTGKSLSLDGLLKESLAMQDFDDIQNSDEELEFGRVIPVFGDDCGKGPPRDYCSRDVRNRSIA